MLCYETRWLAGVLLAIPFITGCGGCTGRPKSSGNFRRAIDVPPKTAKSAPAKAGPKTDAPVLATATQPTPVAAAAPNANAKPVDSEVAIPPALLALPSATSITIEPIPSDNSWSSEKKLEQSALRMRKIALAMVEYARKEKRFPPAALISMEGDLLLSWRVELLPYLGHEDLYNRFHRNQFWSNPRNLPLAQEIPEVYRSPFLPYEAGSSGATTASVPKTTFVLPLFNLGLFAATKSPTLASFTDRPAETLALLMLDDSRAEPWTQPSNPGFDPLATLGTSPGGCLAAFVDGEVRWLPAASSPAKVLGLLTRGGGEAASRDTTSLPYIEAAKQRVASTDETPPTTPDPSRAAMATANAPSSNDGRVKKNVASQGETAPAKMDARLPLPESDVEEKAAAAIKSVFKAEIEKVKKSEKRSRHELATTLLENADKLADDPAAHYVLLEMARENAAGVGDYALAQKALTQLIAKYKVEDFQLQRKTLVVASKELLPFFEKQNESLLKDSVSLLKDAIQRDDFAAAKEIGDVMIACNRRKGDRKEILRAQSSVKECEEIGKAYRATLDARETLASSPEDAEANYVMGRYLCLLKLQWREGLPFLARGSHLRLKGLANEELAHSLGPEALAALANEYWEMSEEETSLIQRGLQLRSLYLYEKAMPMLRERLDRVQAERRRAAAQKLHGEAFINEALKLMEKKNT